MNPEKIGRYEIKSELGRGGMATVYRAYDPTFEREVALKILPRELLHDVQFRVRFEREAKTVAKLEHTAIVPVYDVGDADGLPYFVMRYMTGGSLTDLMQNGPIPLDETVRILDRLAAALDYAHSKGIIHRDLKPANIMFDDAGEPFVSDFGIAKFLESQTNLTGGSIIGTPAYMSPEQAQGEEVDARSDIYALGVIAYEMLSGKPPYEANTPLGLAFKHVADPIPHILDLVPKLPATIEPVLEKALAKKRNDRFGSASSFAAALATVARGETPDLTRTLTPTTFRPQVTMPRQTVVTQAATNAAGQKTPPARTWIYLLVGGLIVLAFFFVIGRSLFSGAATPEPTSIPPTVAEIVPTIPPSEIPATETLEPRGVGGADMIAFIAGNNVWTMKLDASDLAQITYDSQPKSGLHWLADGKTLVYIAVDSKCAQALDIESGVVETIVCFDKVTYFDSFEVSPDGQQVAISVDRQLFVVPFDRTVLTGTLTRNDLVAMAGCVDYDRIPIQWTLWSPDTKRLAVLFLLPNGTRLADTIRVMDISNCKADPLRLDEFPADRFTPEGYSDTLAIPSYDWDGGKRFVFNTFKRNEGFGELYYYETGMTEAEKINPIDGSCCYRDARFSPDGKYLLFMFQDFRKGEASETQMYYILFDQIGSGGPFTPLPLPPRFFSNPREKPIPVLRPAH
jgi:serine/threonine-protein kinase